MKQLAGLLAGLWRHLLQLGVLGLLLLALYASVGRQLMPLLAEYRGEVESQAAGVLHMPVHIGRLEGQWSLLSPHLLAHDVVLGEGEDTVRLEQLRVVVDVFGSLWRRRPTLEAIEVESPRLGLVQHTDGHWEIRGIPRREGQPAPDVGKLIDGLQQLPRLTVYNGQVTVAPLGAPSHTLTYADLQLSSLGHTMRLEGRALLPDGQSLALNLSARIDPAQWQQAQVDAYLSLPRSQWADWLPPSLTGSWQVQSLQAGGDVWLRWGEGRLSRAALRLNAAQVRVARGEAPPVQLDALGFSAFVDRDERGYRLLFDNLAFERDGQRWGEVRVALGQTRGDETRGPEWQLWANRLEVGPLVPLVEALAPLPPVAAEWLTALQPAGSLYNLSLHYRPEATGATRLSYALNVHQVSVAAHGWVPSASGVSGLVQGDLGGGELRLDAQDASLQLARLFPEPWQMRTARGRLRWTIDDEAVTLVGPYLQVESPVGHLAGDFLIRLRRDPAAEDYMDLRVGLRDGDARFAGQFIPSRSPAMSEALTAWLKEAIRGGTVEEGYFQYQGALNADLSPAARSLSLYLRVADAELAYRPGWPALREGRGEVFMHNGDTRVRVSEARVLDSRVHDAVAEIARPAPGEAARLQVEGQVQGPLANGLQVLREAPLGLNELFSGWAVDGQTDAHLSLDIPFAAQRRPRVVVDFSTRDASLVLANPALRLERLEGRFRYDTAAGLSAEALRAQVLGEAVSGRAEAIGSPQRPATRIQASGQVAVARLQEWLGIAQHLPASGRLPYRLQLTLDGADSQLKVESSLQGVAIDLPEPFGKDASTPRPASLRMTLQGSERRYWAQYADRAALSLAAPPGEWASGRGELRLGGEAARLPNRPGLRLRGSVPVLDLAAWRTALQSQGGTATTPDTPLGPPAYLRDARLHVGRFEGFGTRVEDLDLALRREAAGWSLSLASDKVQGDIGRAAANADVLGVHLAHLRLPAADPAGAPAPSGDPLAAVDPARLPPMDITIDQLWYGDEALGRIATHVRPVAEGARFSDIQVSMRGLHATGVLTWGGARTHYKGWIDGEDIGDVLAAWGFARSATSERFGLAIDGSWPGSPARFSFERLSGRLEPSLRNGRFIEVEGGAQALRVFGLLNFHSIGRRLRLDFSDLLDRGLSFDRVHGVLAGDAGVYVTRQPLVLRGPSSDLELNGTLDLASNRIDAKLLVTLPVSNNLPLAAILAGAPAVAGALWIADRVLGDHIARFATVQYDVQGPWQSPAITFDKPFEKPQ